MLRSIAAVLSGALVAGLLIGLIEYLSHLVYPPPAGLDPSNAESVREAMAGMPAGALLAVLIAWFVGTAAGSWLAARIATRLPFQHAAVVGMIMLAGAITTMIMIPHPLWFRIIGVLLFLPASLAGGLLVRKRASIA